MCHRRRYARVCLHAAALAAAAGCGPEVLTPEAARAKGDAMLKQMSQALASSQAFSYRTEQEVNRVRGGGEKVTERFSRHTIVRRPNQLAFTDGGQDHDTAAWYDGKQLTVVMNRHKIWVRGPMPGTLDEAMDYISAEYAMQVPTADLLYTRTRRSLHRTPREAG
jgi:hypothetical protein